MGTFNLAEVLANINIARYQQVVRKLKRTRKKMKDVRSENAALKRRNKRLLRRNARLKKDIYDLVYEVCPHCNDEIAIRWDVEERGYTAYCPSCGGRICLCSQCDKGIDECGICGFGYADDSCLMEVER